MFKTREILFRWGVRCAERCMPGAKREEKLKITSKAYLSQSGAKSQGMKQLPKHHTMEKTVNRWLRKVK